MQNAVRHSSSESLKDSEHRSGPSSPTGQKGEGLPSLPTHFMADLSESEDEEVSEVDSFIIEHGDDLDEEPVLDTSKFLLAAEGSDSPDLRNVDPETQARLEALLEAAGIGKLSTADGKHFADPEVLRKLTSSVSCALDEAAAALTRMRAENSGHLVQADGSLAEACNGGDVGAVRKLLDEGRSVHETNEEGESLLSLACSAGYYELAQVLLAMRANVEDRGIKGDCTPLMEAASAGHVDIVRLLIAHGADVNAQSSSGNTPLMYACAGGHEEVVKVLLDAGSNVEDHNENGHTPLMEAASAGHVGVARILLQHGAGINTHSNEFKESALTLACYKGHLEMVRFLLEAGADQEHKTDEMHTALMEASMDGHVEVAKLLLDSGAQVNMPADSFESPLTLAACGGHVELAMLLLERGANIEEVNDEGYTPLMEAAREGHEEMVALLLSQGAFINAQTEETQESALTLACCGGFLEVADFLIKAGADIELGASTPLMEAAQEGHLDLVRYLLDAGANVHAQTQTGDTALTYACENGHTDVADLLLQAGADLEHESEGGRTPLMKAARAGHLCTVQFLISRGADVNQQTTNNDHTPLSLASAGGHLAVVELLLAHGADPTHRLKDNSTMLIEAAKGGHTAVVQLLLDYPHNMVASPPPPDLSQLTPPNVEGSEAPRVPPHGLQIVAPEDPDHVAGSHGCMSNLQSVSRMPENLINIREPIPPIAQQPSGKQNVQKSFLRSKTGLRMGDGLSSAELQQIKNTPQIPGTANLPPDLPGNYEYEKGLADMALGKAYVKELKRSERFEGCINSMMKKVDMHHPNREEQILQKQQILEELQRVERELQEKAQAQLSLSASSAPHQRLEHHHQHGNQQLPIAPASLSLGSSAVSSACTTASIPVTSASSLIDVNPPVSLVDLNSQLGMGQKCSIGPPAPSPCASISSATQADIITERPKVKPVSKKDSKNKKLQVLPACASDDSEKSARGIPVESQQQQPLMPPFPSVQQPLLNPEALQTLSLKAVSQSEQAVAVAAAVAETFQASTQNATLPLFDPSTLPQALVTQQQQGTATIPMQDNKLQKNKSTMNQQTKNQLNALDTIPLDSPVMVTVGGAFPVSLTMTSGMMAAAPVAMTTATVPLLDEGLMVAAPARTLHETLGDSMTGPMTQQSVLTNHQVEQQYITTNSVGTQCIDRPFTYQTNLPLPFLPNGTSANASPVASASAITGSPTSVIATGVAPPVPVSSLPSYPTLDVDSQTDSNHDTALTLACAGGHEELVQLLLNRGADIEHRDKKGFTPLILAATAGHVGVVEILLNHGADIEAQSERTKDTPLSLACSGGRYEVVELLLARGANKEHRNVSDYTPLSLAASGGYVNIIKLLLNHGAEINSRTGSKLGISPLMLAAMNGHTAAVKLLLDMGGDINAQIETNRNTALTLACFQGRHEVVSLLVDRKANVEHRAKTGLTPLMEAASGGYVEVGRVLLDKGADVNAPPVPSSRDTALTIAADKGHYRFVELLLSRGAQVDVKNKKGNSPLWLAANGGHLDVVQLLVSAGADIDSQDNRKVSCLMAAFRKGHVKVVKWKVKHVTQFPSDQEMTRYIATISDKELLKKCHQCMEIIRAAKDRQAAEANKYATILLEELDMEKTQAERRLAAAARRRERKRKKKKEKQEKKILEENKKNESKTNQIVSQNQEQSQDGSSTGGTEIDESPIPIEPPSATVTTTIGSVITTTTKPSKQSNNQNLKNQTAKVKITSSLCTTNSGLNSSNKKKEKSLDTKSEMPTSSSVGIPTSSSPPPGGKEKEREKVSPEKEKKEKKGDTTKNEKMSGKDKNSSTREKEEKKLNDVLGKATTSTVSITSSTASTSTTSTTTTVSSSCSSKMTTISANSNKRKKDLIITNLFTSGIGDLDDFNMPQGASNPKHQKGNNSNSKSSNESSSSFSSKKMEISVSNTIEGFVGLSVDGYEIPNLNCLRSPTSLMSSLKSPPLSATSPKRGSKREEGWKEVVRRSKKVLVPANAISRVIGRGGCNINAIREVSGAHIEVEKQKGAGDRTVIIKGSADATRQAHQLITALIKDPDRELLELIPRTLANKTVLQSKSVSTLATSTANQASITLSTSNQLKASSSSTLSLSSRTTCKSSSSAPNPTVGIYSTPPFPATQQGANIRQASLASSNSRPGIPVSPLSSAFSNASNSAWSSKPSLSSTNASQSSPKRIPVRTTAVVTVITPAATSNMAALNNKTTAARQLFPTEKRSVVTTVTSTKTTVSYTTANSLQGKSTVTVLTSGTTFAKVTESKSGLPSSQSRVTGKPPTIGGIRAAQSAPNISQAVTAYNTTSSTSNQHHVLMNGPLPQPIGSQPKSQPSTPTSSGPLNIGNHNINPMPMPPQNVSAPQEYSPFNNLFSQVAQSVWAKEKDGDSRGMNFASVAASSCKQLNQSTSNMTCVSVPLLNNEAQPVDAAKAPGYRGNTHVSPGSVSNSNSSHAILQNSQSPVSNSAPNTPPLGPIAPPSSLSHGSRRSPSPLLHSPPLGPSSLQDGSPGGSPVLSSSAPGGTSATLNSAALSMPNLASSLSSPNGHPHSAQLALLASQSASLASNLTRPLHLNPPSSSYAPAASPHTASPRFTSPTALSNPMLSQNSLQSLNNSSSTTIQSNLNPNAPDFSSRSVSNVVNPPQPPVSFLLNRLTPFGDGPAPTISAFRPIMAASAGSFPGGPVGPHQGLGRLPFLPPMQQQQPPGSQQEMSHQNMVHGPSGSEALRLLGNPPSFGHRQQPMGSGPVTIPVGPQQIGSNLNNQHFSSLQGAKLMGQRSSSTTPSMGTSSKDYNSHGDEGSPIATISPVGSPHSSNPASPTGMSLSVSSAPEHQMRAIGEDRKYPRPIGTERANRKTPVCPVVTADLGGIWSFPSTGPTITSDGPSDPQDENLPVLHNSYIARFGENLGPLDGNNPQLEQHFQPSMLPPPHVANLGINSPYPPFSVNGMHPQMISQLYGGGNGNTLGNGLMNEAWTSTMKLGAGDSVQGQGPAPHFPPEQKMIWNSWSQLQM